MNYPRGDILNYPTGLTTLREIELQEDKAQALELRERPKPMGDEKRPQMRYGDGK